MGLSSVIQQAVTTAFGAMGDMVGAITVNCYSDNPTYDAATGAITSSATAYSITKALWTKYKAHEVNNSTIMPYDSKLLILQSELTVMPKPKVDTVIDADSNTWDIIHVGQDPASAIWILQVRRS